MKKFLAHTLIRSGMDKVMLNCIRKPCFLVLAYHRVRPILNQRDQLLREMIVSPDEFEKQISYISSSFRVISLQAYLDHIKRVRPLDESQKYAVITFDDGYKDNFEYALPILKKLSVPASVFVSTDVIENQSVFWWDRLAHLLSQTHMPSFGVDLDGGYREFSLKNLPDKISAFKHLCGYLKKMDDSVQGAFFQELFRVLKMDSNHISSEVMSWSDILRMESCGVSFGSHGHTHRSMAALSMFEASAELTRSRQMLSERLKKNIAFFAYPFGEDADHSEQTRAMLAQSGYEMALTMKQGLNKNESKPFRIKRVGVGGFDDHAWFRLKVCGLIPALYSAKRAY